MTTKTDKLKPCPLCGGEATLKQFQADGLRIECPSCHIKYEQRWLNSDRGWLAERMAQTWNTRAPQKQSAPENASEEIKTPPLPASLLDVEPEARAYATEANELALQQRGEPVNNIKQHTDLGYIRRDKGQPTEPVVKESLTVADPAMAGDEWLKQLALLVDQGRPTEEIIIHASKRVQPASGGGRHMTRYALINGQLVPIKVTPSGARVLAKQVAQRWVPMGKEPV